MDSKSLSELLSRSELRTLDFKLEPYDFSGTTREEKDRKRAEFAKDVVCMANTPRDEPAYIRLALDHYSDPRWHETIRLFAGLIGQSGTLIMRGAEKNPFLAWQLLRDANEETPALLEQVTDEAYCALSAELKSAGQGAMAGGCIFVLADLERADLLEQAISEQRQTFEPERQGKLSDEEKQAARERQKQVVIPLLNGLLLLIRLGLIEQKSNQEGRFCRAARLAIHGLQRIKAARALVAMLSSWTGTTFEASALLPGEVLEALIDLGPDAVLKLEVESLNQTLAKWLKRASEAGFSKAWPAYGRVLRRDLRGSVTEAGLEFGGETAFKWLSQSHEAGDRTGTLELALLLIEEPDLSGEAGEGERMLRKLAETNGEARCELGLRLLKGESLPKNEAEGFEHLLLSAESGHSDALREVNPLQYGELVFEPVPHIVLPTWAKPFKARLKALFPDNHSDLC